MNDESGQNEVLCIQETVKLLKGKYCPKSVVL